MAMSESFVSIKQEDALLDEKFPPLPTAPSLSREDLVRNAIGKNDWEALRELSCLPLGFGDARKEAWKFLLNAQQDDPTVSPSVEGLRRRKPTQKEEEEGTEATQSSEDAQSPEAPAETEKVDPPYQHPDERQVQLDTDRSFVMYPYSVDLPEAKQKEKASMKEQLNEVIVSILRKRRRLGYFQGYHDVISVLFLTLGYEDPELLSCCEKMSLHRLRDSMGKGLEPLVGYLRILKRVLRAADPEFAELTERSTPLPYFALSNILTLLSHDVPTLHTIQHVFDFLLCRPPIAIIYLTAAIVLTRKEDALRLEREGEEGMMHSLLTGLPELLEETPPVETEQKVEDDAGLKEESVSGHVKEDSSEAPSLGESWLATSPLPSTADLEETPAASTVDPEETPATSVAGDEEKEAPPPEDSASTAADTPPPHIQEPRLQPITDPSEQLPAKPTISLLSILEQASTLMSSHPPTHNAINASEIMGPQSVLFTWSESPSLLPTDDEAELMVLAPQLVVLPFKDEEEEAQEQADREYREARKEREREKRRKLQKRKRVKTTTIVAGAVVVLGVAAAVYGVRMSNSTGNGSGGMKGEFRKAGTWIGQKVLGMNKGMGSGLQ